MFEMGRPRIIRMMGLALLVAVGLSVIGGQSPSTETDKHELMKPVVHVYSEQLSAKDKLVDGPDGKVIEITSETTLVWVDLVPDARFAHDTEYLLITAEGTKVIKGQWWLVVNGQDVRDIEQREFELNRNKLMYSSLKACNHAVWRPGRMIAVTVSLSYKPRTSFIV
jgi:hypothetical protein